MPGRPVLQARHYQELAPRVAMDRVKETTPLQPGVVEYKYYAPGIGLVVDASLKLVRYGKAALPKK